MANTYKGTSPNKIKCVASVKGAALRIVTNDGRKFDVVPRWFGVDMPRIGEDVATVEARCFVRGV